MNITAIGRSALVSLMVWTAGAQVPTAMEPSGFAVQQLEASAAARLPDTFRQAKNVVLFLGDGMGISTITAARILDGQNRGASGEENRLFFENFEYTAFSKTYSINQQTPDSASTMTAIMTGHKTKAYVVGYDAQVILGDHTSTTEFGGASRAVETLVERFEKEGKATGIVTTTRLTHATPACCYAHSADRNWEDGSYTEKSDERLIAAMKAGVKDIARQLIEFPYGDGVDVAFGGGRSYFLPKNSEELKGSKSGNRIDDRNLIDEWQKSDGSSYVATRRELLDLDVDATRRVLGLFADDHMTYVSDLAERGEALEPSLEEMATTALKIVRRNSQGFFLMIEGGRIDHAHHASNAHRALVETIEFDRAIRAVFEALTPKERAETLILVTADHSHTFTMAGYPTRGNPILGMVRGNDKRGEPEETFKADALGLPYTTLGYANGTGFPGMLIRRKTLEVVPGGSRWDYGNELGSGDLKFINTPRPARPDLSDVDSEARDYIQESTVPMTGETHGGEDVAIYARGPGAHLFRGSREQNYIYHAILQALIQPSTE